MPIYYAFDPQQQLLETTVSGDVRFPEIREYLDRLLAEPWFPAPSVTDVCGADGNLPGHEVREIADRLRKLGPRLGGLPVAVVVGSELSYGLVRMLGLLMDDEVNLRPFRDRVGALAWLEECRKGGGPG